MRAVFYSLLVYFLTPLGLVLLAALDSSLIFFLPLGIDFGVIVLSARKPELFWMYALLATVGSLVGAMITFWIGRKIGEHGLTRLNHGASSPRSRASGSFAFSVNPVWPRFTGVGSSSGCNLRSSNGSSAR